MQSRVSHSFVTIEMRVQAQNQLTWLSRTTWKDSVSVETASQEIVWDPEVPQTVSSSGLVTLIALAMAKKAKVEMRVLVNIYASVTGASIPTPLHDCPSMSRGV